LGVMGCGKVYDNGDPLPDALMGDWEGPNGELITIAGNQATVIYLADAEYTVEGSLNDPANAINASNITTSYRIGISYLGLNNADTDADGEYYPVSATHPFSDEYDPEDDSTGGFIISFYDFKEKKNNKRGEVLAFLNAADDLTILTSKVENNYYLLPPIGDYSRP